ncbi:subtilase family protein [Flavobacterium sp. 1]|uniref:S8 family serine peptidase n=1 Tax=Flavobacterium sp. 1 TaxID=2035200 RepID=UPI000C2393DA|nr:S8 family serine peptidase [Flavobacterium sp. 1]PJJ09859.1 subtilase family protein [Flavobacterium sp. 1]
MKSSYNLFLFVLLLFSGCKSAKQPILISDISQNSKKILQYWYQKDYDQDGNPGISLDKWYAQNKNKPKSKNITVAVIDTQIDKNHEDLKDNIWINPKEIVNNGIDDDHNGYIDDINGWNFTGTKNGGYIVWGNFEYVRFVRMWNPLFKNKIENEIPVKDLPNYKEYLRAEKILKEKTIYYKNLLKITKHCMVTYSLAKDSLKHYFPKEDYTYQELDSMYKKHKINNKTFGQRSDDKDTDFGTLIDGMMVNFEVNQKDFKQINENATQSDSVVNKNLNLNYNERISIGDNPDFLEKGYGTNNISINKEGYRNIQNHSTEVSGIIAANRNNNIGIKGIAENAKIMPLCISFSGDEHDKDITMAIRYAVDNGAKIINMSFGKEFSLHKEWVFEAFKYAEEHNVLLVHCAGNNGFNVDENPYYPSDNSFNGTKEVCNNFINVGSISSRLDSTFVSTFSNYGKQNVDLFAPGEEIYTTSTGNNTYVSDSGTSLAGPMVSGTAALIWSYYPNLTATEVKQIILDSGTAYDLEVIVPDTTDKKVPFSELSKSGKVLNVYNAMQMAEKVSKHKS